MGKIKEKIIDKEYNIYYLNEQELSLLTDVLLKHIKKENRGQEIIKEIEKLKYIDKDFIERDGMEETRMKMYNSTINYILNYLKQKLTNNL